MEKPLDTDNKSGCIAVKKFNEFSLHFCRNLNKNTVYPSVYGIIHFLQSVPTLFGWKQGYENRKRVTAATVCTMYSNIEIII